jgi:hypothetical protein
MYCDSKCPSRKGQRFASDLVETEVNWVGIAAAKPCGDGKTNEHCKGNKEKTSRKNWKQ